jgi:hypothetical protein
MAAQVVQVLFPALLVHQFNTLAVAVAEQTEAVLFT